MLKNLTRQVIAGGCLLASFLSWTLPTLIVPFVNVLPYVQTGTLFERLVWAATFHTAVWIVALTAMTTEQIEKAKRAALDGLKEKIWFGLGILMAIFFTGWLSANSLGLLVKLLPGEAFERRMLVVSAQRVGARYSQIDVELESLAGERGYAISLSKKVFGELPKLESGDLLVLMGKQNLFGSYVESFGIERSGVGDGHRGQGSLGESSGSPS